MTWRVIFARSAEKDLKSLSADVRSRVGRAIRRLEQDAFPPAIKRLKGREEFRMRVGDYRVLYVVSSEVVTIMAIGHRRDVYR